MAATGEQQQPLEVLPIAAQLDRVERLISTHDELEDYIAILLQKVQGKMFPDRHMLDRLERLLRVLQRFDQETRSQR